MRSTFSILFYINRGKVKADGTTAVMCRITIDGRSTAITTGIYCRPEDWNAKTGTTRTVRENARLQEYRKYIEQTYEEILRTQGVVSAEIIKNRVTRQFVVPTHLLRMGEIERERLRIRSREINSTSTYRQSQYFQKYLTDYLASLGKKDIAFEEINGRLRQELQGIPYQEQEFQHLADQPLPLLAEPPLVSCRGQRDPAHQSGGECRI